MQELQICVVRLSDEICFEKFGDIHKIGLHPERRAIYLSWVYGYKTGTFYNLGNDKPISTLFSEDNGLNKPKFEGFTPSVSIIGSKSRLQAILQSRT